MGNVPKLSELSDEELWQIAGDTPTPLNVEGIDAEINDLEASARYYAGIARDALAHAAQYELERRRRIS